VDTPQQQGDGAGKVEKGQRDIRRSILAERLSAVPTRLVKMILVRPGVQTRLT